MIKFIEVTLDGQPAMVNIRRIEAIEKAANGCVIHLASNYYPEATLHTEETYEQVRRRIMAAISPFSEAMTDEVPSWKD